MLPFVVAAAALAAPEGFRPVAAGDGCEVTVGPVEGKGNTISKSALTLRGDVPGMSAEQFVELANKAKASCPVSRALGAIEITLDAQLEG